MQLEEPDKLKKCLTSSVKTMDEDNPLTSEKLDTKLEGTLGPLVHQIKLLRESFDDQYSCLDDKYTRLETVITFQKKEMSNELGKLHELITRQKQEITATVEKKIEASNEKLE